MNDDDPKVIDLDVLGATLGGDRDLIRRILEQLQETLRVRRDELHRVMAGDDPQAVHEVTHPLKGALAGAGAEEARRCVERMDDAARHDDMEGTRAAYGPAGSALERLEDALKEVVHGTGTGDGIV